MLPRLLSSPPRLPFFSSPCRHLTTRAMSSLPIKFAVLDDYHNIAAQHFAHIDPSQVETTVFNDTLPSYSHPKTPPYRPQSPRQPPQALLSPLNHARTQTVPRRAAPPTTKSQSYICDGRRVRELGFGDDKGLGHRGVRSASQGQNRWQRQ
jgi:hypothetical protein